MPKIEFRDENDFNYVVSVPVLNQEKPILLRMWVAYDVGNRCSYCEYAYVKRGFYLYFSFEEPSPDYPARILMSDTKNCRLYLGEVKRKSKGWYKDFANLAGEIVMDAIKDRFTDMSFDWEKLYYSYWSGKGTGVGLFSDFYQIVLPKKEWIA